MNTIYNEVYNEKFESFADVSQNGLTPLQIALCKKHAAEAQYMDDPTIDNHIEWYQAEIELADWRQKHRHGYLELLLREKEEASQ
jgi:hypothetical protein